MKFILFVEGKTEDKALPAFLKRWLDARLERPVGIQAVKFNGWPDLVKGAPTKARMFLNGPKREEIIAIISLLDLYGPNFYPTDKKTVWERYYWAKKYIEEYVGEPRFHQFFSVHEVEAWLLSDPDIFPQSVRNALPGKVVNPESINFDEPPKRLLKKLYQEKIKRIYKESTYGKEFFSILNPDVTYAKCPSLKLLLDEMLKLAKEVSN